MTKCIFITCNDLFEFQDRIKYIGYNIVGFDSYGLYKQFILILIPPVINFSLF